MKKYLFGLSLLILLLTSDISAQTAGTSGVQWRLITPMQTKIYASYVLATTADGAFNEILGQKGDLSSEGEGLIGVVIDKPKLGANYKLTLKIDGLADEQEFEVPLTKERLSDDGRLWILPNISWNYDKLRNMRQPVPANGTFTLSINGGRPETKKVIFGVRPPTEALFAFSYEKSPGQRAWRETAFVFGAYVNPDHPWIDKLLQEALESGLIKQFDGYQSGDSTQVVKQVFAIWNVLQKRGFKYSSITNTSTDSWSNMSQHVRLFEDSIATSQANCIDGSVMLISILQKIGIRSDLVLIPGHAFIIIDPAGNDQLRVPTMALETTMMGAVDLKEVAADRELVEKLGAGAVDQVSLKSFIAALDSGKETYGKHYQKLMENRTAPAEKRDPRYNILNTSRHRMKRWLAPISRDGSE